MSCHTAETRDSDFGKAREYISESGDVNSRSRRVSLQMTRAASIRRVTVQAFVRDIGRVSAISTMSPSLY